MDISNFFSSRRNVIGLVVAALILVLHLIVGLGALWPVVALAGWGAAFALVPAPAPPELSAAPQRPREEELVTSLDWSAASLYRSEPTPGIRDAMTELRGTLTEILIDWERLGHAPEQRVIIEAIIEDYLPRVIAGYHAVHDRTHPVAVGETLSSLSILNDEAGHVRDAIVTDTLRELEDHTRALRMQFGRLPEPRYDTEP